jgi:AraC-like DNA-binding protein
VASRIVHRKLVSARAAPESATRLVGAFTAAPALIRQLGVDPAPIIAAAGLELEVFSDPSNRIPYEGALHVLNEAAVRTRCPHIGLLLGRMWGTSDLGLLGELVRHSPTVGTGLQEFVVNHHLNSEGALAFVVHRDKIVDLGYAVYVPFAASCSPLYDGALAALVSILRELCGDGWSPAAVFLTHSAPDNVAPYREYFQAPLHFGSDVCVLRFGAHWLDRPVAGADPQRLRLARAKALAIGEPRLVEKVQRTLRTLLLHSRGSGADVAQSLAMHRRTLDRRLSAAGTTFQEVLDRVRFAVTKELLDGSTLTLIDITATLGYADEASFIRAFRRWTGTTPGAWRDSAR